MSGTVLLRDVTQDDLPIFFEHQRDPEATQMAGFPSREREAFMAHWAKVLANPDNDTQAILFDGVVAGNIVSFTQDGEREVGYWLGREFWGKGIATRALTAFLEQIMTRPQHAPQHAPLHAHVVKHNIGSRRVLEKCGFVLERETEEEFVLRRDAP